MLEKIIKTIDKSERELVLEIGSNSDLILENTITNNLVWTIENFQTKKKGKLTFPTKFGMVDSILNLNHKGNIIARMSVNPEDIIRQVEFGTSPLDKRIEAINKLSQAGYEVGIIIAPVIFVENWENIYLELIKKLESSLSEKAKGNVFFEVIFMTYSYVHMKINEEAFQSTIQIFNKELMTGRGKGKYWYNEKMRQEGTKFFNENLTKYFPNNRIAYIV